MTQKHNPNLMELVDKETEMVPDKKRGFLALFDLKHVWEGVAAVFKWRPNHKRTFLIALIIIFEMEMFVIVGISLNFLMDKLLLLGKRNNSLFRAKNSFCLHKFLCTLGPRTAHFLGQQKQSTN